MNQNNQNTYGKLDERTLIFKQIDRINQLTTYQLQDMQRPQYETFVQRFTLGVRSLESLLTPIKDETFKKRKEEKKEELSKDESDSVFKNKDYAHFLYQELISLLFRNNIYWGDEENIVIDQTEEEEEAYTLGDSNG